MPPDILDGLIDHIDVRDVVAEPPRGLSLEFRHRTVSGVSAEKDNIEFPWYWTKLDHPALNGHPQAIATVTPVGRIELNGQVALLRHNTHPVGLVYRNDHWYIYNLDLAAMENLADFNVAINEDVRDNP